MEKALKHHEFSHACRVGIWSSAISVLVMLVSLNMPVLNLFEGRHGDLASVHLLLEMFSVIVSVLIVTIAWHMLTSFEMSLANPIILGFSFLAIVDVAHAISYEGMPGLLIEGSTNASIFYWLIGRVIAGLVVLAVATRLQLQGNKAWWLLLGGMLGGVVVWLGVYHLDVFPVTFVPGEGVTAFKRNVEVLLCICYTGLAAWLLIRGYIEKHAFFIWLSGASFVMGVGELLFTSYLTVSDFRNMLGHIFKIASYALIFRAIFIRMIQQPFQLLETSREMLKQRDANFQSILDHVPHGVIRLDAQLKCLYINELQAARFGATADALLGLQLPEFLNQENMALIEPHLQKALHGEASELDKWFHKDTLAVQYGVITFTPEFDETGNIKSVLLFITDNTQRELAQQQLISSLREMQDMRVALNAHAIVVKTDAYGTIVNVNDKFCEISKYSRSELIGQSHRLINSGYHPKSFFRELWNTISSGKIWNGEICNRAKDGSLYWVHTTIVPYLDDAGKPVQYMAIRADITARKQAEQEIERLAYYDYLTNLPNRRYLVTYLENLLLENVQSAGMGAVLFFDLDNFKVVNDTFGHATGDVLLQETARRLGWCITPNDVVARLGGDEFVIVLKQLDSDPAYARDYAFAIAENVRNKLAQVYTLPNCEAHCPASIGIAMFDAAVTSVTDVMKQADMALYQAKTGGKNRISFFDAEIQAQANAKASLLADLRQALQKEEFQLYYQPVVDQQANVLGFEALIRWIHPVRGMVPPFMFIELAEQSGLIVDIGQWVLETACKQLVEWQNHPEFARFAIAINVSSRQFAVPDYPLHVLHTLKKIGAPATKLRLELTESLLLEDAEDAIRKMKVLREQGIQFSLDDFGTGYSSLSYLRRLPFDNLKIDRSFVSELFKDENAASVIRTIISLAASLGIMTVAEGVETKEQYEFLVSNGCDKFQGYYFGRPVPLAHILADQGGSSSVG